MGGSNVGHDNSVGVAVVYIVGGNVGGVGHGGVGLFGFDDLRLLFWVVAG